jgi:uncharacterized protein
MKLDLTRIHAGTQHVERSFPAAAFGEAGEDYRVIEPVRLSFDLERADDRYHLVGQVSAVMELGCSRCTEPFALPVDASFDLRYLPHSANVGEGELEVGEEHLGVAFYQDQEIDLGQLMREQFYLTLPMKPLCRPDCRGLCPQCGTNLNLASCDCQATWEDPRLAELRRLAGGQPPSKA